MTYAHIPAKQLWLATLAAFATGLLTLVIVIMPAEYNIDPTGIGTQLGLTALSPEKLNEAPSALSNSANMDGLTTLVIPAGSGKEFKLEMTEGGQVDFEWITDGASIYVDTHGEPFNDPSGYFKSYVIATTGEMKGSFTAPFAGTHGWYFRNDSQQDITIQLFFEGQYENPHAM
ncbi:hypothetical protein [Thalassolituus sp. UBA2009]|jgi:hypothetical protein|uniref:hypothetical protein n=1 Tax=Thalassolituus sp. UBA2009 TaxID=1947658 RepID=UPI000C4FA80A|nr:hypothetical protein [Thalassolituus sp. UBA2009]MAY15769.1 hypothetical protein [Oceanospirillaceae bacterium]|tara:strand:+ start:665 stop:1186 length:522 start_codon:yes stop_codon:yes gene_type:complete